MREAEKSLHTLGVTNIFFLGYGDTSNHYSGGHLFYHENDAVTSPAGHRETYGASHFVDYAFQTHKAHSPYCRAAMRLDLESLILHLKADIIFVSILMFMLIIELRQLFLKRQWETF